MKKKTAVNINQFLAMIPVEVASDFVMEYNNSEKSIEWSSMKEYFSGDLYSPHKYVLKGFPWDTSIKGPAYWNDVCLNLKKQYGGGVTFSEFIELLEPIERHRINNAIEKQRGEDLLNEMYSNDTYNLEPSEWLEGIISWDSTEEGSIYWIRVCNRLEMVESLNETAVLN
jgi:hypothetical protein